ncbi:MAG: hypothetical protein QOG71_1190 [Pyrinomonadaceae bacterium]|nr:hypothetical protein [Pyrinomonadaceae bacterium]
MRPPVTPEVVCEKLFDRDRSGSSASRPRRAPGRLSRRAVVLAVSLACSLGCALPAFAQTPTPDATPAATTAVPTATAAPPRATPTPTATATPAVSPTVAPNNAAPPANAAQPTVPGAAAATLPAASEERVSRAYRMGQETPPGDSQKLPEWQKDSMMAGLNDIVIVEVKGLKSLLERAKCKTGTGAVPTCRPKNILLFIEGRPLKGMEPESGAPELPDGVNGTLRYHLKRPPETSPDYADAKEHWADLLGLNNIFELFEATRDVSLSVGLEDEYPIASDIKENNKFHLLRARQWRLLTWGILLLACLLAFWQLAKRSDIVRDRKPILWGHEKPYSLSRSQAAWWFFFVIIGFIFIWLVTGQRDLSPSVLVLLGIGFATAISSTVIDQSRTSAPLNTEVTDSSELTTLLQQKDALERELSDLKGKPGFDAKWKVYEDLIQTIRTKFPDALGWNHTSFHIDILSDANGVNFHRFQMVVWTVVLGIVFIHEVLSRLAMPEFSTTLLTLMGISSGTYLFGKSTEPTGALGAKPATGGAGGGGAAGAAAAGGASSGGVTSAPNKP